MRRPRALRPGDTVALVAPASPLGRGEETAEAVVGRARQRLESAGLHAVVGRHALAARGYLAGRDDERAADLMAAFADPSVGGIICLGGGYGSQRLLPRLDFGEIARHPKVFVGYSDITALHAAIGRRAGFVTFHGAMGRDLARLPRSEAEAQADEFTWEWLLRAITRPEPLGRLPAQAPWQEHPLRCVVPGRARGPLVGGNLSLLVATLGTPYEVDTVGRILLIEDVDEPPYRIDRMLTHLMLAGKLQAAAGFVIAEWVRCEPPDGGRPTLSLDEVVADLLVPLGKPAVYGLAAGHGPGRLTLPLGAVVTVDADAPAVIVEEPGVEPA
ncbi:MAG TPA: LD-carboxypeptidase [Limnochordales bacterium]